MSPSRIQKVAKKILPHDLVNLVEKMFDEYHPLVGGKLKDLMLEVKELLPHNSDFYKGRSQFAQLRFAKMAVESASL